MLTKSYKEILAFFRKIKDDIVKWFKGNLKEFESSFKKIEHAFNNEGKTEEFFRKIQKKLNLAGEEILTPGYRAK